MNIVTAAFEFAAKAHEGQTRKYTGEPYIVHCRNVGNLVAERTSDPGVIAAAYLHDTLEDTNTRWDDLVSAFGERVARLVWEVTDRFTRDNYPQLNRRARKIMEAERIRRISDEAKLIKLCDLIDNTSSIVKYDPDFAVTYLREKADLLEAMGYGRT